MKRALITGGAGYIGSHLVDRLTKMGISTVVLDNFSTGRREFMKDSSAEIVEVDLASSSISLSDYFKGVDTVYHLAANADVRFGWNHPLRDLEQNVFVTARVAEAAANAGVAELIFSSTGSIYGEASVFPTPETVEIPLQTSLYGASKVSAEAFLGAYSSAGKFRTTIFRFVSVLGPRYSHGHVFDFVKQLRENPSALHILGDGKQRKSYMHVSDCVDALVALRGFDDFSVFNLGAADSCVVDDSAGWIIDELRLKPEITYSGGTRGWVGDNPFILLDVSNAKAHGWETKISIEDSVRDTVRWLEENSWIL